MTRPIPELHVRTEMRRVWISARGARLTKHAAYVAAAKHLIALKCECEHGEQCIPDGHPCTCNDVVCRFHEKHTRFVSDFPNVEPKEVDDGMVYYVRVRDRLVRFLKFVDARRARLLLEEARRQA